MTQSATPQAIEAKHGAPQDQERLPPVDRLLSTREVLKRVKMGSTTLYRRLGEGTFPRPVRHGSVNLWRESAISNWIAQLPEVQTAYVGIDSRNMGGRG